MGTLNDVLRSIGGTFTESVPTLESLADLDAEYAELRAKQYDEQALADPYEIDEYDVPEDWYDDIVMD